MPNLRHSTIKIFKIKENKLCAWYVQEAFVCKNSWQDFWLAVPIIWISRFDLWDFKFPTLRIGFFCFIEFFKIQNSKIILQNTETSFSICESRLVQHSEFMNICTNKHLIIWLFYNVNKLLMHIEDSSEVWFNRKIWKRWERLTH